MASRELYEIRDINKDSHSFDFLTVGSMGHSSSIALGIAKAKPKKRIICLDGDGAALMHLGSMAIIGTQEPENLVHIVLNNGSHDSVGGQPSVAKEISLTLIAKACNYKNIYSVSSKEEINSLKKSISSEKGPIFIELIIKKGSRKDLGRPKTTPLINKENFMKQLKL
jgi:phosphonopyruvate decarboxylase